MLPHEICSAAAQSEELFTHIYISQMNITCFSRCKEYEPKRTINKFCWLLRNSATCAKCMQQRKIMCFILVTIVYRGDILLGNRCVSLLADIFKCSKYSNVFEPTEKEVRGSLTRKLSLYDNRFKKLACSKELTIFRT